MITVPQHWDHTEIDRFNEYHTSFKQSDQLKTKVWKIYIKFSRTLPQHDSVKMWNVEEWRIRKKKWSFLLFSDFLSHSCWVSVTRRSQFPDQSTNCTEWNVRNFCASLLKQYGISVCEIISKKYFFMDIFALY